MSPGFRDLICLSSTTLVQVVSYDHILYHLASRRGRYETDTRAPYILGTQKNKNLRHLSRQGRKETKKNQTYQEEVVFARISSLVNVS